MTHTPTIKLSKPQIRALQYLVYHYSGGDWVSGTPVTQKCINVLAAKGLVQACFEPKEGFLERITDLGIKAIFNQGLTWRSYDLSSKTTKAD